MQYTRCDVRHPEVWADPEHQRLIRQVERALRRGFSPTRPRSGQSFERSGSARRSSLNKGPGRQAAQDAA